VNGRVDEDLLRIKGFGYAIVTQLSPYLLFPELSETPAANDP
jgi:hypothetical protein